MNSQLPSNPNRTVFVGGSVVNGVIVTGDGNTTSIQKQQTIQPQFEIEDIQNEIAALKRLLLNLESDDQRKIERAFEDVEEELEKAEQLDKDEVGKALDRALSYAQKANGFAETVDKLCPHIRKITAWLGQNWHRLLSVVGL